MLHTSDFDFELPPELIASHPLSRRDASRMLVVGGDSSVPTPRPAGTPLARGELSLSKKRTGSRTEPVLSDRHIRDFLDYIQPGDVVVFNNSRVIPARFMASGHEITLHTAESDKVWWGLCKKFNKIPVDAELSLDDGTTVTVLAHDDDSGLKLRFNCDDVFGVLNAVGKMPLPPYMKREEQSDDRERYQTVYADPIGSMAAPTAGLHFTPELMDEIERRGATIVKVTLHVGAGTWMPVKTEDLSQHKMHSEWCQITPAQADIINNAKRVIAVGTTSMRTLESAAMDARKYMEAQGWHFDNSSPLARGVAAKPTGCRNLPQNPKLKDRARELRKSGSLPEALLWREIGGKKINGLNFNRQKVIGNYIVDFFCPATYVVIEIDDAASHDHKGKYDATRDAYLKSLGLVVLHFSARDILKDMSAVTEFLRRHPALRAPLLPEGNQSESEKRPVPSPSEERTGKHLRVVPICRNTNIFITPGYKFGAVDVLLTNFHLPKSTLFMLVSAFAGLPQMRAAYEHAVAEKYRFFSYGDCCLLFKKDESNVTEI